VHEKKDALKPDLASLIRVFLRIGCLSFGGPAGQIALMHRELVETRSWIAEKDYLAALNFCMLLPGPEAMQLATYVGWKLHGWRGGLAAGLLFVLPGACVVLGLSMIYAAFEQVSWLVAIFYGVKAAVMAIVIEALLRVARRALKGTADWLIAALAFLALFVCAVPFPVIIIAAGLSGFFRTQSMSDGTNSPLPSLAQFGKTAGLWLGIWLVPLLMLGAWLGPNHVLSEIGLFFSKLAVVTFGGAYAVLSYMSQAAVEQKAWLQPHEMIDGLGLAETTPGPLILVTQFVGYIAALRSTGSVGGGIAGAVVTLWATFAPCFLFIFAGAPYIEAITSRPRLKSALAAITAAVVGVIFNLSLWFGLHVLFGAATRLEGFGLFKPWVPNWSGFDGLALLLSALAAVLLLHLHWSMWRVLLVVSVVGAAIKIAL
jgi:chromate transporter